MTALCRRAAVRLATRNAGIPAYNSDIAPVRGKCLGRVKRKPCGSRWGVIRVSLDFRDPERVDRLAILECASCGRKWRRVKPPAIRSTAGYQSVRLDVILPASADRWYSRGAWHREGDDAQVLRDADLGDVDEAARAHNARLAARLASKAKVRERREEADREAVARARVTMQALALRDAEREAEERAAEAREG